MVVQLPAPWQTCPVPRPGGESISPEVTVKLRMSCLLRHLCAEFSEYLTMLLPLPLLCHTPTPMGLEILPGFHLFSTPVLLMGALPRASWHAAVLACPLALGAGSAGRQLGKPLEKHDPMQMSKARSAFPPQFVA